MQRCSDFVFKEKKYFFSQSLGIVDSLFLLSSCSNRGWLSVSSCSMRVNGEERRNEGEAARVVWLGGGSGPADTPRTPPSAAVSRCHPLPASGRPHRPSPTLRSYYRESDTGVVQHSCPLSCPLYTPPLYLALSPPAL